MELEKISKASVEDVAAIVRLVNSAYRGESSRKGWTTEADLLDGIRIDEQSLLEILENSNNTVLKYTEDAILQGCVVLEQQGSKIYLGMLTVDPLMQNKGIGKKLIEASIQIARRAGFSRIVMTVITTRLELIAYYERAGFTRTGKIKPFPNDPRFGIPKQQLNFEVLEKIL